MQDIPNSQAQIRDPNMTDQTASAEQGVQLILLSSSNNIANSFQNITTSL